MSTSSRLEVSLEVEIEESLFSARGSDHHIAATTTITSIRASAGHVFLASETYAAVATVPGPNVDFDFINKTHGKQ
jgi:hypothetical protein